MILLTKDRKKNASGRGESSWRSASRAAPGQMRRPFRKWRFPNGGAQYIRNKKAQNNERENKRKGEYESEVVVFWKEPGEEPHYSFQRDLNRVDNGRQQSDHGCLEHGDIVRRQGNDSCTTTGDERDDGAKRQGAVNG